jgi:hypothetical protein
MMYHRPLEVTMRSRQQRVATAKATVAKALVPLTEAVQATIVRCSCGGNGFSLGQKDGRMFAQCSACRTTFEIAAQGLTTVKKAA